MAKKATSLKEIREQIEEATGMEFHEFANFLEELACYRAANQRALGKKSLMEVLNDCHPMY